MIPFTLRQLEYAVAVAEERSFRRAAERCHVSQPALSAQIQQLEDHLELRIFERDRRGVLITEAGREVVSRAERLLIQSRDLAELAARRRGPLDGILHLGVIPTIAPYALPELVAQLHVWHPRLRLRLREGRTEDLVADLEKGTLDLLLLAAEADLGHATVAEIARDPFILAVAPGHRLASKKTVRERDLVDEPVLVLEDGHCFGDQALAVCRRNGASDAADFRASSLTTLVQMVAAGEGITLLPELAVPVENRRATLELRDLGPRGPHRTLVLAWRPTSPHDAAYRDLAAQLRVWWPTRHD